MSERFFSTEPISTDRATLGGAEAHHLLHVMRARVGDEVTLFDGSGWEFTATIEALGRSDVTLRVIEKRSVDRELSFPLTVAVALPKGDRQKWLVEKLTELGVSSLVPLTTQRGVAQPTASALDRLRRSAIEAAKQCGRNRLMHITEPLAWSEWLNAKLNSKGSPDSSASMPCAPRRLVADPSGTQLSQINLNETQPTQVAIGPEGGFTNAELAVAVDVGWQTVDLGPRILRVETAAIALAAVIGLR